MHDRTQILPADSKTVKKLVPQALTLGNSGKTTVLNLLGVHLERIFGEAETLLNESGKLTDPTTLLPQDFLGVGSTDNDLENRDMFESSGGSSTWDSPQYEHGSLGHRNRSIPPRRVHG